MNRYFLSLNNHEVPLSCSYTRARYLLPEIYRLSVCIVNAQNILFKKVCVYGGIYGQIGCWDGTKTIPVPFPHQLPQPRALPAVPARYSPIAPDVWK